eukprot:TRINITY_DN64828_c0_g1_i1.p1 TRINITY_DN64828_c0_g1~~TRINITY_DN64828_c0_g1_i1.p1  ORF type:complete len:647 (+),score=177.62 TRINITY_DN64828_c0_g1_i1:62-1942(+)
MGRRAAVGVVLLAVLLGFVADIYVEYRTFQSDPRTAFRDEEHGTLSFFAELVSKWKSKPALCPGRKHEHHQHLCKDKVIHSKLSQLDRHTRFIFNLFKSKFVEVDPAKDESIPAAAEVMAIPKEKQQLPRIDLGIGFTPPGQERWQMQIPYRDEEDEGDWHGSPAQQQMAWILGLLAHGERNPLEDQDSPWDTLEQGRKALAAAAGTDLNRRRLHDIDDHTSDEAISRWAFSGLAAHRLECPGFTGKKTDLVKGLVKVDGKVPPDEWCIVNFSWMALFAVRPGFEKYGATAYFTKDRKLTKIWWDHGEVLVHPANPKWEHAKWAWKCSVLVGVTFRDHLTGVHLMAGNMLTLASRERLRPDHPLRRLLKPFTFGTISINVAASNTLVCNHSLVHRAMALPYDEILRGWDVILNNERWYPEAQRYLESVGTDKLGEKYPFGEDFIAFHKVIRDFVGEYIDLYFRGSDPGAQIMADPDVRDFWKGITEMPSSRVPRLTDARSAREIVVSVLSMLITYVTGIHNHVGNVADYLLSPEYAGAKIRPGTEVSDVQASMQTLNIALSTAVPMPMLLSNVDHLLLDNEARRVWSKFRSKMTELADQIDERNKARGVYTCNSFNPRQVLISVSV